jgi:hypothetical protein
MSDPSGSRHSDRWPFVIRVSISAVPERFYGLEFLQTVTEGLEVSPSSENDADLVLRPDAVLIENSLTVPDSETIPVANESVLATSHKHIDTIVACPV